MHITDSIVLHDSQFRDELQVDRGLCADSTVRGPTRVQRYLCGGYLRGRESCSGVCEAPPDPGPADKGFAPGLALQHHDVLRRGEEVADITGKLSRSADKSFFIKIRMFYLHRHFFW